MTADRWGRLHRGIGYLVGLICAILLFVVEAHSADKVFVEGLDAPVVLSRDNNGVMHVTAPDEASMAFAQGYVHARDRLFQMDLLRHTASGTLAELLGKGALSDDIQLRTIGLCRAAQRTLPLLGAAAGIPHPPSR